MHSFDAHHHHHHHHDNQNYFIQEIINRRANDPIFHSNLIGGPSDRTAIKKRICASLMIFGGLLLAISLLVASIQMTVCPIGAHDVSASVSLAMADDDYYNNATLFAFNVHIELEAYSGVTRYRNATVFLRHPNGTDIDEFPIAGARIAPGVTRHVEVTLRMVSRHRLFNGSDPVVRLQTHVRFSGEVRLYKARPVAEVDCDLSVDVESRTLAYSECKTKVSCKAKQHR